MVVSISRSTQSQCLQRQVDLDLRLESLAEHSLRLPESVVCSWSEVSVHWLNVPLYPCDLMILYCRVHTREEW